MKKLVIELCLVGAGIAFRRIPIAPVILCASSSSLSSLVSKKVVKVFSACANSVWLGFLFLFRSITVSGAQNESKNKRDRQQRPAVSYKRRYWGYASDILAHKTRRPTRRDKTSNKIKVCGVLARKYFGARTGLAGLEGITGTDQWRFFVPRLRKSYGYLAYSPLVGLVP